ncbi:NUDIX domain-containing protein [Streptomyces sp. NPDC002766]|uniref:NUDIX domain-containing protein n=1 Tax=Streptomyces sp. NPDC002766 TaxID=3154429 RepID=UPI00331B47CF
MLTNWAPEVGEYRISTGRGGASVPLSPITGAVIAHGGRVLLIRRNAPAGALLWTFPSGKVESGETVGPAGDDDFKELTRLVPRVESSGAQCAAPLPVLVADVVQEMKNLIALPVDAATPFAVYGVRVQQQTRAVDKLLASIDKALTSARQMRSWPPAADGSARAAVHERAGP